MLEKRGHAVVVAGTGRDALTAFESGKFDVILMDVQMPEMNGLEATAAIRQRERAAGGHVPILAMTAHAMKGDKETCLEAGMDAYLSKPINADEFFQTLNSLIPQANTEPDKPDRQNGETFNIEHALAQVDGDPSLLAEIAGLFLQEQSCLVEQIRNAAASADHVILERTAHTIKGSLGIFGAQTAMQVALDLEKLGRSKTTAGAEGLCARLEQEIGLLLPALDDLRRTDCRESARS
jgi:CheY-like chemotaxis protein/HPt (histidine-containing phosphotransfer) domain-containing protein